MLALPHLSPYMNCQARAASARQINQAPQHLSMQLADLDTHRTTRPITSHDCVESPVAASGPTNCQAKAGSHNGQEQRQHQPQGLAGCISQASTPALNHRGGLVVTPAQSALYCERRWSGFRGTLSTVMRT